MTCSRRRTSSLSRSIPFEARSLGDRARQRQDGGGVRSQPRGEPWCSVPADVGLQQLVQYDASRGQVGRLEFPAYIGHHSFKLLAPSPAWAFGHQLHSIVLSAAIKEFSSQLF